MWKISKRFRFEASHVLPSHAGKCARLHGHSWVAVITLASKALAGEGPEVGMVADFGRLRHVVQPIVDRYLDHHHLNETTGLANPTSEHLAWWLFEAVSSAMPDDMANMLDSVTIEETCTSSCEYRP